MLASGQLQNIRQLQNNSVDSAMLITMNHVITVLILQVTVSVIFSFIFLSLTPVFHKIDWKIFKGINYIRFAFHYFCKYTSKIKILSG